MSAPGPWDEHVALVGELVHALGRISVLLSDASAVWYADRERAKMLVDRALTVANGEGR